jgi:hypothetical protein
METMNSSIVKTLLVASIAAFAMGASAQTPAPPAAAPAAADKKLLSDNEIKSYKDGRKACNQLTGAPKQECQKKLAAKFVDKQCSGLSGEKLDDCIRGEYPGE